MPAFGIEPATLFFDKSLLPSTVNFTILGLIILRYSCASVLFGNMERLSAPATRSASWMRFSSTESTNLMSKCLTKSRDGRASVLFS